MKRTSVKPLPVGYPVYHAISRLNRSFEDCTENLAHAMSFNLVPQDNVRAYQAMIEEIRALVNQDFVEIISEREFKNSAYYERLHLNWQSQFQDKEKVTNGTETGKQRKAVRR